MYIYNDKKSFTTNEKIRIQVAKKYRNRNGEVLKQGMNIRFECLILHTKSLRY